MTLCTLRAGGSSSAFKLQQRRFCHSQTILTARDHHSVHSHRVFEYQLVLLPYIQFLDLSNNPLLRWCCQFELFAWTVLLKEFLALVILI